MSGRRVESDDDYESSVSEEYKPTKKRRSSAKTTRPAKKKAKHASPPADDAKVIEADARASLHPSSRHVIQQVKPMRDALMVWYAGVHATRGMPWRKPFDPSWGKEQKAQRAYEVWISEIMLQQTQVATVIPYYDRWMARFPDISELAASDIDTVNGLWKGLGYYSRAARILAGAQKVVKELGGTFPDNAKDMEAKVPGIGRYSAGAICSIAYNECVPVLDGNVHRLLSRVLAINALPKAKATLDVLWAAAAQLVEGADRPGDLNQALIELGSTVCKVKDPKCAECPIRASCKAYQLQESVSASATNFSEGDIEDLCKLCEPLVGPSTVSAFPMKAERKKPREEMDTVNVIEWCDPSGSRHFLLVRRPEGGLLGGLHEFPTFPNVDPAMSSTDLAKVPHTIMANFLVAPPSCSNSPAAGLPANGHKPLRVVSIRPAGDVLHVFSHIRKTYRVHWILLEGGGTAPPPLKDNGTITAESAPQKGTKQVKGRKASSAKKNRVVEVTALSSSGWTPLDEVSDANIGTGVVKIWNLVKALWEC